jgi:hypothetical protein
MRPASCALLALLLAVPSLPAPEGSGTVPPFGAGDWVVTGDETFADRSIILAGDLVIMPGGSLTISNASLTMFSSYPGEHQILVRAGGTLRVLDGSLVNSFDPINTHRFGLVPGSTAVFANSTFIACGIRYEEVNQQITGGIISGTENLTVDNSTFTGAHVAMTLYAGAAFTSSSFITNYIGVISLRCWMDFERCSFSGNILSATWPYKSRAYFGNSTFVNNSIGVSSDASDCVIKECTFAKNSGDAVWASSLMHWYMPPSQFWLEDCLFEDNTIGIGHYPDVAGSSLDIVNCDFLNNSLALDWDNSGDSGDPPPDVTHWTTTRRCRALNNRFLLNGNISVERGGVLDLSGSNLTFDSDFDGESGMEVLAGGKVLLSNGSLLRANWGSRPYALRCLPGSAFHMNDTVLRDCGWDLSSASASGPLFEGSEVRIRSSVIDYNPVALQFNGTAGAEVSDCTLRGLDTAVELDGSSATFRNSSIDFVSGPSASLTGASELECINSTIDRDTVRFDDNESRLNLSWYLDVRARWADGSPAEGALVSVLDLSGAEVVSDRLGADGRLRGLVLREASLGRLQSVNFTPHAVNISRGAVFNTTSQRMDRSRAVDIVLEDRDAPSVVIAYPAADSFLSSGTVFVNGTAQDNLAVKKVEVVADGFRRYTAYSADGTDLTVVGWDLTLAFLEGPHTIEARAYDRAGNFDSAVVSVTVDWSAPRIRIASPSDGHLTNLSVLPVSGFMEPGSRVLLGGSEVKTERDLFGGTVILGEGINLVSATAFDRAGNANSSSILVRLDSRPPALDVIWPPEGLRTNIPMVAVNGTMEPGCTVTVNGRPLVLSGEEGTFRTAVALPRETNLVVVDAADFAGNHNVTARTVVLDTRPPALEIESPPEGLVTNRPETILSGVTEGGAILSVNGDFSLVPGEPGQPAEFALPLRLPEGPNTIFISVTDGAGNLNFSTRHVVVDTLPPALSISAPADGHRTTRSTLFIIGETEPGVVLTINSRAVPVGQTGSFSLEVKLASGPNRFTARAVDEAGNSNETAVDVQRLAGSGEDIVPAVVGPDWPFAGFVLLAAGLCISEGYFASRYVRKRRGV